MSNAENKAYKDRLHREPATHRARAVAKSQNRDHLARRVWMRETYSYLHYKNMLRCPEVVFAHYGGR